jgi:choline dehydrogenase-like flavoprotein
MEPRSRGSVRLTSPDPNVDPEVAFDLLSDELDMARMVAGVRYLGEIIGHSAVSAVSEFVALDDAGTTFAGLQDESALREWLVASVQDYVHACGTCRMGRPDDPMAVVDPSCRYIGIDGLWVVDASVMPVIPRANTNLTTVMIAEKAAAGI